MVLIVGPGADGAPAAGAPAGTGAPAGAGAPAGGAGPGRRAVMVGDVEDPATWEAARAMELELFSAGPADSSPS